MNFDFEQINIKLLNELNIKSDDVIFRKMTEKDIDDLYDSYDSEQWLIPFYLKREANHYGKNGHYLIEHVGQKWKIFNFPFNHEHNDMADWFVYLDKSGNMVIIQERFLSLESNNSELKVLFCSDKISNSIENICLIVFYYGYLFEEMSFDEYWKSGYANPSFKYSFATDKGRYV